MRTRNRHWHALTVRSREPSAHKVAISKRGGVGEIVGTLALKKRLVLNASCRCLLGTLLGEKS